MSPASLSDATLVIATGDDSAQLISDLTPIVTPDPDSNALVDLAGGALTVRSLVIPDGAILTQHPTNPGRSWNLSSIVNDGDYIVPGGSPLAISGVALSISGHGAMSMQGPLDLDAVLFRHDQGHLLRLRNTNSTVQHNFDAQQFENAGDIHISHMAQANVVSTERFDNTGPVAVVEGAQMVVTTPILANEGVVETVHPTSLLQISSPDTFGQINLQSTTGRGRFTATQGATLQFTHTVLLDNAEDNSPAAHV